MIYDDQFSQLKADLVAIEEEIMLAIMYHEAWKPMAYDKELHARMGTSFATHTFRTIQTALRREVLLALWKLWDTNGDAVKLAGIVEVVKEKAFFEEHVTRKASRLSKNPDQVRPFLHGELKAKLKDVKKLVGKYRNGKKAALLTSLTNIRHERLAHRQKSTLKVSDSDFTDKEFQEFYNDNLEIVRILLSLVLGTAFDLTEAAGIYRHHASYFWINVRGEQTEGHPRYRKKPPTLSLG